MNYFLRNIIVRACLLATLLAVGCENGAANTPKVATEKRPAPSEKAVPSKPVEISHIVKEGETLWDIARAYDTRVKSIQEANVLRGSTIRPGMALVIPGATERVELKSTPELKPIDMPDDAVVHILQHDQTLWEVARAYDLDLALLMERNDLNDEQTKRLRPGRALAIPGAKKSLAPTLLKKTESRHAVSKKSNKKTAPKAKFFYASLRSGESVWHLAKAFQVSVAELMALNRWSEKDARLLRDGTRVRIPGKQRGRNTKKRARPPSPRQQKALALAKRLGLGTRSAASRLLLGKVKDAWIVAAGGAVPTGTLRWPVSNGRFVRGWGSGEGGYHLAVDIVGEMGWNVRAADAGIVAYSGNGIRGYGNVVLVIHPGGFVTMYAHNSVNFVVAGEHVRRGHVLAEVGSTGISRGPHVHFEFMHRGKLCDPAMLFRPGVKHKTRLARIPRRVWKKKKPADIKCASRRRHPRSRYVENEGAEIFK